MPRRKRAAKTPKKKGKSGNVSQVVNVYVTRKGGGGGRARRQEAPPVNQYQLPPRIIEVPSSQPSQFFMPPSQQAEQRIPAGRVFSAAGYEIPANSIIAPNVDRTVYPPEMSKMPFWVRGNREPQIVPPSVSGTPSRMPEPFYPSMSLQKVSSINLPPERQVQREEQMMMGPLVPPSVPKESKAMMREEPRQKMKLPERSIYQRPPERPIQQEEPIVMGSLVPRPESKESRGIMRQTFTEVFSPRVESKQLLPRMPIQVQQDEEIQGPRIPMIAPEDKSETMSRVYTAKIVPMEMSREEENPVEVPIQPQKEIRLGRTIKIPRQVINQANQPLEPFTGGPVSIMPIEEEPPMQASIMRPEPVSVAVPIMQNVGELTPPQAMVEFTREERQQAIENVFNRMEQEAIDEGRRYYGLNDSELELYAEYIGKPVNEARKDLEAKLKTNMKLKKGVKVIDLRPTQTKEYALAIWKRAENAYLKKEGVITGAKLTKRVQRAIQKFPSPMSSAEREAESAAGVDVNIPPVSEPSLLKSLSGGLTSIYQGAKSVGQGAAHLGTELITGEDIPEGGEIVPVLKKSARKITSKAALKGAAFAAERAVGLPPGAVSAFI